ncbi:MAG TPA: hypothetical protein VF218_16040 [Acidothermaceae bacterium]|jgi:hypothetical protein
MRTTLAARKKATPMIVLVLVAVVAALMTVTTSHASADAAEGTSHGHDHGTVAATHTASAQTFHDQMRKLWEDHVTWTRLAIVTFADGSKSFDATAARLLQNQVDIGDAIKPFYGDAAGTELTSLLHDHITIAVEILQAAKAGDTAAFNDANTRWYENANAIADFLANANPRFWPQQVMRDDMKVHLDQTLAEASDELGGDYTASVNDYDAIHLHILDMADMLSNGIIGEFPARFKH